MGNKLTLRRILSVRWVGTFSDDWVQVYEQKEIDRGRKTFKILGARLRYILFSYL